MKQYHDLLKDILANGKVHHNRTGIDTIAVFGRQARWDLSQGFPLITTKKMFWHGVVGELLWFLRGDTNVKWLNDNGIKFWNSWADKNGDLGPIYGHAMRKWGNTNIGYFPEPTEVVRNKANQVVFQEYFNGFRYINPDNPIEAARLNKLLELGVTTTTIDQIANVIKLIKTEPNSRRICMTTWNVGDLPKMALLPCHGCFTQFMVEEGKLSCATVQRSADFPIGVPVNIASYALLTHMIAHVCGLEVGDLVYNFNDAHIYLNQVDALQEQLKREPYPLPKLWLNPEVKDIDSFKFEDIKLVGYQHHPAIKMEVCV